MGTLRLRNCTAWDVHYWRESGNSKAVMGPGEEGTYEWGATYTLGVKREYVSPDGKHYRKAVNQSGIYYVIWNASTEKLDIVTEYEANANFYIYLRIGDNQHISNWIKKLPDWMSALDGSHSLNKYSIPGTHDSGTEKTGAGPAHTQNFGIFTQLTDGIRVLDIRLEPPGSGADKLLVTHGIVSCNISFGDVLNDCKIFLEAYRGETIIMLVNKNGSNPIGSRFKHYLEKPEYKDLFYLGDEIPTLDEVRGKIVLFRRFEIDGPRPMGVDLSKGWKDNKTFSLTTPKGQRFEIEDQYDQHNTSQKLAAVTVSLYSALSHPEDNIMYITYNSISWGPGHHTPYQYAWGGSGVEPEMNPSLESFLRGLSSKNRFGVVMLDFYNDQGSQNEIVETLVRSNDRLKR